MEKSSSVPASEHVLGELRQELLLVYRAMEVATQAVREFFEVKERDVDRMFAPDLVRHEVKCFLEASGHHVEELESESLPNNGLLYHAGRYSFRILKVSDGVLPAPGSSEKRQAFFGQQPTQQRLEGWNTASNEEMPELLNLIVGWDVDNQYELVELYLAFPKSGSATKESVETHWMVKIPPLSLSGEQGVKGEVSEEAEDLPIQLKETQERDEDEVG